jgi:hypothetical protein
MRHEKYHGRIAGSGRACAHPECGQAGEFRAPGPRSASFNGPGEYRWLCLDHVREFNAGYDWFEGMSADEILAAQHPISGWRSESPAVRAAAGIDAAPRWADFADPLEAISARARARRETMRSPQQGMSPDERRAFEAMDLPLDADRAALRRRYLDLVRKFHPDRNGGDRRHEARLQAVIEAYQLLRNSRLFA